MTEHAADGWTDVTTIDALDPAVVPDGPTDLRDVSCDDTAVTAPPCGRELVVTHRAGAAVFLEPPDPSPAAALDLLVETVCDLLEIDYAGVHLVQGDELRVLAATDDTFAAPRPRTDSLCGTLLNRHVRSRPADSPALPQVIEIRDTAHDPTLPRAVHGEDEGRPIRFYAATPLYDDAGVPLGTLCVIAHHPRSLSGTERRTLLLLGVAASTVLTRCRRVGSDPAPGG